VHLFEGPSSTAHQVLVLNGIPHSHIIPIILFLKGSLGVPDFLFATFDVLHDEVEGGNVTTFQHDTPKALT